MRQAALGIVLAAILLSIVFAASTQPAPSPGTFAVHPRAVDWNKNYSDPASDVAKLWSSNQSHVTDASGYWILSPSPTEVNLLRLSTTDAGGDIDVYLRVQGSIATRSNVSYEIRLYPRSDNTSHYILTHRDGTTTLASNRSGGAPVDLTGNTTISPASSLHVLVNKTLLGAVTAWDIDATARESGSTYTYEDFVWSQPGNPGSAPAFIQGRVTDAGTGMGLFNVNVTTDIGFATSTNATGYYVLPAAPGTFNVTYSLAGYSSVVRQVTVSEQQTRTVNVALTKSGLAIESWWLWLVIAAILIAVLAAVLLVVMRRKRSAPPPGK